MKRPVLLLLFVIYVLAGLAQEKPVKKVYVIFKTHFDLGYTGLSSEIEKKYIDNFIPKAIDLAEQLREEGGDARYVWTTGTWLIDAYMRQASPEAKKKLDMAIKKGDIVWNAAPYTIQSESVSKDIFESMLNLSQRLDLKYGKKTIAAKMTDVPGHTRSIITPLYDAGIRFLNVGVNNCSAVPEVPPFCRWRNTDGKEIVLMYQKDYGGDELLPDGETVVSVSFTPDNHGPHAAEHVKAIFASLHESYPNAEIVAATLNDVAEELLKISDQLPVLTSEIGDTWIFGYVSSPVAMSRYRALMRLYSEWLRNGKLDQGSDLAINFAIHLGLFAEHTWGVDHLVHIKNWDKYDVDVFNDFRNLFEFRRAELSWEEKDNRVEEAIAILPPGLQEEANEAVAKIGKVSPLEIAKEKNVEQLNWDGSYSFSYKGVECNLGEVSYQTYSSDDYDQFVIDYVRDYCGGLKYYFTKPGLENSKAQSATIVARKDKATVHGVGKKDVIECTLKFPDDSRIDSRVLPEQVHTQYRTSPDGRSLEMTVSLLNKPAVRLPEAYWVSFFPADVVSVFADKVGMPVDVLDVVKAGNRQMHGIEDYFDIVCGKGTIRITSLDAPVASIGERSALNYSFNMPDLNGGIHFCLFNNLWTTNFPAWWEGSLAWRFKIEYLEN
ncbi:DUF5054 domain-containing protein [Sunxiuqinia sp. A32]|uniref:DUF5054 domain-containing protein n=1 Tax=Sunxiuqinia sp. A32 TaxID=3461496 RepID=UPI004046249C